MFIPNKRNKEGKVFGFVRFKEVAYPHELEKRLDQIWIGSYKLRANFTRFFRRKDQSFGSDYRARSTKKQQARYQQAQPIGKKPYVQKVQGVRNWMVQRR